MGILDMLMGKTTLGDPTIGSDMIKDSKFAVFSLAMALTETANPQLRQLFASQLLLAIQQHHQLSDLVTAKDWYKPFLAPQQQVGEEVRLAAEFTRQ